MKNTFFMFFTVAFVCATVAFSPDQNEPKAKKSATTVFAAKTKTVVSAPTALNAPPSTTVVSTALATSQAWETFVKTSLVNEFLAYRAANVAQSDPQMIARYKCALDLLRWKGDAKGDVMLFMTRTNIVNFGQDDNSMRDDIRNAWSNDITAVTGLP